MDLRELRNIRLRRGLSQADLSAITGVAEYTISEIEAGKRPSPRPSTLRKLAHGLGVEVADLYGESEYPLGGAPPTPQPSFNDVLEEERRRALIERFVERWRRHIEGRAAHYEKRMTEAEHGGIFAGHEGARVLFEDAWTEFVRLLDLTNAEMAERWLEDPEIPEDVKTELGFKLVEAFDRMGKIIARITEREATLAETEAQRQEAEQRRSQIRELTRKISA
jgi:transcriptional regulator with XRE-family HTH domain